MTARHKRYITEDEYDALEETSAIKHEYFDGKIYAMTGGTEPHNLIAGNTLSALHVQLRTDVYEKVELTPANMNIRGQNIEEPIETEE